ncbi:TEN1 protein, partial [Polyodon spathula]|nr:TEN1 protein [Polyodon spathula]
MYCSPKSKVCCCLYPGLISYLKCCSFLIPLPDGCPGLCNGNGRCTLDQNGWHCVCQTGWSGTGCNIIMEMVCDDSVDNDGDGLMDCVDPDCCQQASCYSGALCQGSPDPLDLIQQSQTPFSQLPPRLFFQRTRFLIGRDSTHVLPGDVPFDSSRACVIRGQVVAVDGTPLVGVNVSFLRHVDYGYTISRQDGSFDLVAVGGISVTLIFERAPFITERRTLWLPWNQFVVVDKVIMTRVETAELTCDVSNFISPYPIVLPSPLTIFAGSCSERGPAVPELQAVQEEITIPGSFVKLSYLSTRTPGYKSLLRIILTHSLVPTGLAKVHLTAAIEGRLLQRWFPATPNLAFTFAWNKTDIYGQKVSGLTEAIVSVGYEYEACPDFIVWEKRTALLQGFEMDASNLGGWSLDKHHILNLQSGILHKGNGENIFISQQPPVITTVMGNGYHRSIPCPNCNGPVQGSKLFAPIAVACGPDSSVYVGDFNFIRRILPSGYAVTILELRNRDTRHSTSPAHKYYLAVDPVNESLYLSDTSSRKILRVKSLTEPKDLAKNFEVVAGTGDQCLPFDQSHCGDGGKASEASLNNPREVMCQYNLVHHVKLPCSNRVERAAIKSKKPRHPTIGSCCQESHYLHLQYAYEICLEDDRNTVSVFDSKAPSRTWYCIGTNILSIPVPMKKKPVQMIPSLSNQELYLFSTNGTHLHTLNLITGDYIYNFTYSGEQDLSTIISSNGNSVHIRRDANGVPLWLVVPGGQVYWLTISNNGALKRVSAQGHDLAQITYHGNSGLLATKSNENGWTTVYE